MKKYIIISILIHFILLSILFLGNVGGSPNSEQNKTGTDKNKDEGKNLVPNGKKENEEIEINIIQSIPKILQTPKAPECASNKWYGGVGIVLGIDSKIVQCPEYYPAYRSGVRVNDIILNNLELRGNPGTEVIVILNRDGKILSYKVIREKICTE